MDNKQWFKEAKFGMMIHFGLYSLLAGEWKGKRMDMIAEWAQSCFQIPIKEYEKLIETAEDRALLQAVQDGWEDYLRVHEQIMAVSKDGSDEGIYQARVLLNESTTIFDDVTEQCIALEDYYAQLLSKSVIMHCFLP